MSILNPCTFGIFMRDNVRGGGGGGTVHPEVQTDVKTPNT